MVMLALVWAEQPLTLPVVSVEEPLMLALAWAEQLLTLPVVSVEEPLTLGQRDSHWAKGSSSRPWQSTHMCSPLVSPSPPLQLQLQPQLSSPVLPSPSFRVPLLPLVVRELHGLGELQGPRGLLGLYAHGFHELPGLRGLCARGFRVLELPSLGPPSGAFRLPPFVCAGLRQLCALLLGVGSLPVLSPILTSHLHSHLHLHLHLRLHLRLCLCSPLNWYWYLPPYSVLYLYLPPCSVLYLYLPLYSVLYLCV